MAKFQFKGKSSSAKLNYKPSKVPAGLNPREADLYNRFYSCYNHTTIIRPTTFWHIM